MEVAEKLWLVPYLHCHDSDFDWESGAHGLSQVVGVLFGCYQSASARCLRGPLEFRDFVSGVTMVVPKDPASCQLKSPLLQIRKEGIRIADATESEVRADEGLAQRFLVLGCALPAETKQIGDGRIYGEMREFLDHTDGAFRLLSSREDDGGRTI